MSPNCALLHQRTHFFQCFEVGIDFAGPAWSSTDFDAATPIRYCHATDSSCYFVDAIAMHCVVFAWLRPCVPVETNRKPRAPFNGQGTAWPNAIDHFIISQGVANILRSFRIASPVNANLICFAVFVCLWYLLASVLSSGRR